MWTACTQVLRVVSSAWQWHVAAVVVQMAGGAYGEQRGPCTPGSCKAALREVLQTPVGHPLAVPELQPGLPAGAAESRVPVLVSLQPSCAVIREPAGTVDSAQGWNGHLMIARCRGRRLLNASQVHQ